MAAVGTESKGGEEFRTALQKAILDESPDGILFVDQKGYVASVNEGFSAFGESINRRVRLMIPSEYPMPLS